MTTPLADLRDRLEEILADTGNAIWSTGNLDEAIRQAVHEYSLARPQEQQTSITLTADGREISTSTITDANCSFEASLKTSLPSIYRCITHEYN